MTTEKLYREFVCRMFVKKNVGDDGLMHAAAGISGEAGEVLDLIKKVWVYGKPLDPATIEKLVEELGDTMFYMQGMMNLLGVTPSDVRTANINKLEKRYPNGFSEAAALARVDKRLDRTISCIEHTAPDGTVTYTQTDSRGHTYAPHSVPDAGTGD